MQPLPATLWLQTTPPSTPIRVLVVMGTQKLVKQHEIQLAIHSIVDVLTDYM